MMAYAVSGQFFTTDSLATLGGSTLATIVVGNAIATIIKRDLKVVPFIFAIGICILWAADTDSLDKLDGWVVAVLNGCLVFCTAAGVQVTALVTATGAEAGRHRAQAARLRRPTPWLRSWLGSSR